MFLSAFVVLFVSANARDLVEPKFQVLTPDELMVEVPHYEDKKLVTFRIGVRRSGRNEDDLELGENDINNNRVFIYDQRLNLKKGDVVNYLLAFKDESGYQAHSGNYYFNGVYFRNPLGRRQRFRRHVTTTETTFQKSQDDDDTEEFNPTEPRFGFGGGHHGPHHGGPWSGPRSHGFNPWGPSHGQPGFPPYGRPTYGPPDFGRDCNDHRHDMCHGRDTERWINDPVTVTPGVHNHVEFHCRICDKYRISSKGTSTTARNIITTTEEESPDIDIRFSN